MTAKHQTPEGVYYHLMQDPLYRKKIEIGLDLGIVEIVNEDGEVIDVRREDGNGYKY